MKISFRQAQIVKAKLRPLLDRAKSKPGAALHVADID